MLRPRTRLGRTPCARVYQIVCHVGRRTLNQVALFPSQGHPGTPAWGPEVAGTYLGPWPSQEGLAELPRLPQAAGSPLWEAGGQAGLLRLWGHSPLL